MTPPSPPHPPYLRHLKDPSPEKLLDSRREYWLWLLVFETISCSLAVCSWASNLTSLGLSFLPSKLGAVIIGHDFNRMLRYCGSHKRIHVEHQIHSNCSDYVDCYCYYDDCHFLLSPWNYTTHIYFYHFKSGDSLVGLKLDSLAGLCGPMTGILGSWVLGLQFLVGRCDSPKALVQPQERTQRKSWSLGLGSDSAFWEAAG